MFFGFLKISYAFIVSDKQMVKRDLAREKKMLGKDYFGHSWICVFYVSPFPIFFKYLNNLIKYTLETKLVMMN